MNVLFPPPQPRPINFDLRRELSYADFGIIISIVYCEKGLMGFEQIAPIYHPEILQALTIQ